MIQSISITNYTETEFIKQKRNLMLNRTDANLILKKMFESFIFLLNLISPLHHYKLNWWKRKYKDLKKDYDYKTEKYIRINNELITAYKSTRKRSDEIKSSIEYAKSIQSTILPIQEKFNLFFNTSILYLPKDIVSGDFYWISKNLADSAENYKVIFALADCTGHGVPGAFMTLIGERIINEVVNLNNNSNPTQILELLDKGIQKALQQNETYSKDGMDAGICQIEKQNADSYNITFAGAKHNLIYFSFQQNKYQIIRGAHFSLGGTYQDLVIDKKFSNHELTLYKGDRLFFYTDGLTDQFNKNGKKFGREKLMNILSENADLTIDKQSKVLEFELSLHKQFETQIDDITVIGIEL